MDSDIFQKRNCNASKGRCDLIESGGSEVWNQHLSRMRNPNGFVPAAYLTHRQAAAASLFTGT